jgi:beta-glucosidase
MIHLGRRSLLATAACVVGLIVSTVSATANTPAAPRVTGDARVDALLERMSLDEKLTMVEGTADASADPQYQAGYLPGIPRLHIPSLKLTDGPPGVVTKQDSTGMTATMGVAATFSQRDAEQNGVVIGRDAKALGQDVVLEPFVNIDRDTSWGRGFNTFGEDPLLTGQTGAAEITGIQAQGEMAQVKHYIAYDGANNVNVDEQTLHEIYLAPFADAIDAGVSSVMCSYNVINSSQSCGNAQTLTAILRNELGFKGFVTSDWGATHATTYLNAGLDMEMPGSGFGGLLPQYFSKAALKAAIANGSIQESRVTEAAGRILYEYDQFGLLSGQSKHTVTAEDRAFDNKVVQQTGEDAATLLKNDGNALPLSGHSSLALIGPGAGQTIATDGGGEKSGGIVREQVGTYQVLQQMLGSSAQLSYAVADDMTGVPVPASALSHNGQPGLLRTNRDTNDTQVDAHLNFTHSNSASLSAGTNDTWTGTLTVPASGDYWLNIQALGGSANLTVDGKSLINLGGFLTPAPRYGRLHATDGNGPLPTTDGLANGRTRLNLTAGAHSLSVAETADISGSPVEIRLSWVTPAQQQANHDAAVAAAKSAGTAVVFAWAGSGNDLSQALPEGQDQLIEDIAAVNPNTVVVLNSGEPVAMPWLSKVKAVLEMWYPGDRGGYGTANTLLGKVNPGGKLPFTWPASIDQELAHQAAHPERSSNGIDSTGAVCAPSGGGPFANTSCITTYSEGVDIGYRFFDATDETPLFPFGYGLSYTSFGYSNLNVAPADDGGLTVAFRATNTGNVAGDAVPQVYLGAPASKPAGAQFAPKALAAYTRVHLDAGQSRTVTVHVPRRQLQYWSTTAGWTTATGDRVLYVSTSERADALQSAVTIS